MGVLLARQFGEPGFVHDRPLFIEWSIRAAQREETTIGLREGEGRAKT
jgi:hypothetical protein